MSRLLSFAFVACAGALSTFPPFLYGQKGESSKAREVPKEVLAWAEKNHPDLSFPPLELFFNPSFRRENLTTFLKSNRGWPPFCISADFNGDGKSDYAFILYKDNPRGGVSYRMFLLHGDSTGFKEFQSLVGHLMGSVDQEIGTRLVILEKGRHLGGTGNSEKEVSIARDSISIVEDFSQSYWVWDGKKYQMASLFAD